MLHVIQSASPISDPVLRAMFAARKTVFVDLLRWTVPVVDGVFEVDQFDDGHATYLVLTGPDGRHLGSARLLPTRRPHILDGLYADLCDQAPPRADDVFEITRFCLDRRLRAAERRSVRDILVTALVAHALDTGITAYSAIAELAWFQQILAFGWCCSPLGLPRIVDGTMLAALRIDITAETPRLLIAAGITPAIGDFGRPEPRIAA